MSVFIQPIYTQTVGPSGSGGILFSNIPQNFTDLKLVISARGTSAGTFGTLGMQFGTNNVIDSSSKYSLTYLQAIGGGTFSSRYSPTGAFSNDGLNLGSLASNTFTTYEIYIPNYSRGNFKSAIVDSVASGNSSTNYNLFLNALLYSSTNPINSLIVYGGGTNLAQHTTVTLYGISNIYDTVTPNAPSIFKLTDIGGAVSIDFATNDFGNGATAKNYSVDTAPTTTTTFSQVSPIVASGLTPGQEYTFTINANNSIGSNSSRGNRTTTYNNYSSIATVPVTSSVSTITFNNIPQNYKNLQIRYIARMEGTGDQIRCQFNLDTSASYSRSEFSGNGTSAYGANSINVGSIDILGFATGSQHTANIFGIGIVDIIGYNNVSTFKSTKSVTGYDVNGSGLSSIFGGNWRSFSPISTITLFCQSGNFAPNSHIALYGIS